MNAAITLYRARNLVERFFKKTKQCRRVATQHDKLAADYLCSSGLHRSGFGCGLMSSRPDLKSSAQTEILYPIHNPTKAPTPLRITDG
jgi:hypothetical protein